MIYLQLLISYLKIGFFGFGGGYAMLSLVQSEVVVRHGWLTEGEFADIVAISQVTPGPVAINSATYVGYTVTGNVWGALIATVAVCLPALTVMLLVTRFYLRLRGNRLVAGAMSGMQPVILGMIAAAALLLITPATFTDPASWAIFAATLLLAMLRVNPILLILLGGAAGFVLYY
jgi:chromate transporter